MILAGEAKINEKVKVVGDTFVPDPYGIGIRLADFEFQTFINNWLLKIQQSGLWLEVWRDSLGTVLPDQPEPPPLGSIPGLDLTTI